MSLTSTRGTIKSFFLRKKVVKKICKPKSAFSRSFRARFSALINIREISNSSWGLAWPSCGHFGASSVSFFRQQKIVLIAFLEDFSRARGYVELECTGSNYIIINSSINDLIIALSFGNQFIKWFIESINSWKNGMQQARGSGEAVKIRAGRGKSTSRRQHCSRKSLGDFSFSEKSERLEINWP